jgi:hypothetical protein
MLKPLSAGGVKLRVLIRCVHQHIGVYEQHYRSSMAW